MIIIHGQQMTFSNPVPQNAGVTGRQFILVLTQVAQAHYESPEQHYPT